MAKEYRISFPHVFEEDTKVSNVPEKVTNPVQLDDPSAAELAFYAWCLFVEDWDEYRLTRDLVVRD